MDINRLANLRQAYEALEGRVQRALNTQVGDVERLAEVQEEVLSYIQAVEQVSRVCMPLRQTRTAMISGLVYSIHTSSLLRNSQFAVTTPSL